MIVFICQKLENLFSKIFKKYFSNVCSSAYPCNATIQPFVLQLLRLLQALELLMKATVTLNLKTFSINIWSH